VVGLLTEKSEISVIATDLASAGVDVAAVEILCGEQGHTSWMSMAATTDCAAISWAFQRLGYDETTLEIYDEALRNDDPAADPACHWRPCLSAAPACCRHVPGGSRKRCGPGG